MACDKERPQFNLMSDPTWTEAVKTTHPPPKKKNAPRSQMDIHMQTKKKMILGLLLKNQWQKLGSTTTPFSKLD